MRYPKNEKKHCFKILFEVEVDNITSFETEMLELFPETKR